MSEAMKRDRRGARSNRGPASLATVAASALVLLVVSLGAVALAAASTTPTVKSASNSTLGESVVVDSHGRTLYELKPETARHLLCKTSECFEAWPPVTVRSSKTKLVAGPGVKGHLGLLRRSKKSFQVTLGGMPLYRFAGDSAAGEANGQGIKSFGGLWHAVTTGAASTTTPSTTPTTPEPAPTPTPLPNY